MHINHITLATGHLARTKRADVSDGVLAVLAPWLKSAVDSSQRVPLPVAALAHYSAVALVAGGALVVTIYGPAGPYLAGQPHAGEVIPLATIGVAQRSRQGGELWAMMAAQFGAKAGLQRPAEPWCAVALHLAIAAHRDTAHWLGDMERCIAWAWITRNPAIRAAT